MDTSEFSIKNAEKLFIEGIRMYTEAHKTWRNNILIIYFSDTPEHAKFKSVDLQALWGLILYWELNTQMPVELGNDSPHNQKLFFHLEFYYLDHTHIR